MSFIEDQAKAWAEIPELTKLSEPIPETVNGPGATLKATEGLREILPNLLRQREIHSILDIGCGDWNWMSHVDLGDVAYLGWDVDYATIERNKERYGERENVGFHTVNMLTVQGIPKVDLILARHLLIHFPNDYTRELLDKLRASGSKYLLTSTWPGTENKEYEQEGIAYRGYVERTVNLEAAPFGLAPPVEWIAEPAAEHEDGSPAGSLSIGAPHQLALYELQRTVPVAGGTEQEPTWTIREPEPLQVADDAPLEHLPPISRFASREPGIAVMTPQQYAERNAEPVAPCEGEHGSPYKVHRADGIVQTKCSRCHAVIESSAADPDEGYSLLGTVSRWAERVTGEAPDEPEAEAVVIRRKPDAPDPEQHMTELLQAKVTVTDPNTGVTRIVEGQRGETKRTRLALVDKQKLRAIRDNHREAMQIADGDPSLVSAWALLGVQAHAIEAILSELTRDG